MKIEFGKNWESFFNPGQKNVDGHGKLSTARSAQVNPYEKVNDQLVIKASDIDQTISSTQNNANPLNQNNLEMALVEQLKASNNELKSVYRDTKQHQGWLGKSWDWIKGAVGSSSHNTDGSKRAWYDPRRLWSNVVDYENSSKSVDKNVKINDSKIAQLDSLARTGNKEEFSKLYKELTSKDATQETLQSNENVLEKSKIAESIGNYKSSQKNGVDVISDITAGITSFIGYSVAAGALVAAPFTGGSSLLVIPLALGAATATGAAVKIGIKSTDAWSGGRKYDSLGYDALMGGVNGILAPITAGAGGAAGKAVATRLGVSIAREGIELGATQASKSGLTGFLTTFGYRYSGGTLLNRATAATTEMAVMGGAAGSIDNTTRHVYNNGWDGAGTAFLQGGLTGMLFAPIVGGGFRAAGRVGSSLGNKANKMITNKVILPDGSTTVFRQAGEDCHLLSVLNGYMKNPQTAKKLASSIETTMDGHYKVRIGNRDVIVNKAALKGQDLAEGAAGVKIIEEAYRSIGGLKGGFAEQVAKDFNLNPVRINTISDEVLDTIAKNQHDYVLSAGAYVDEAGNLVKSQTAQKHLLSVENIDAKNRTVTLRDSWDTSKTVKMSYDDFKQNFHSIDGGRISGKSPFATAAREANETVYKASQAEVNFKDGELSIKENGQKTSYLVDGNNILTEDGNIYTGFHKVDLPSGKRVLIQAEEGKTPITHTLDKQAPLTTGDTIHFTVSKEGKIVIDPADVPAGATVSVDGMPFKGNIASGNKIELNVGGRKSTFTLTKKGDVKLEEALDDAFMIKKGGTVESANRVKETIFKDDLSTTNIKGQQIQVEDRTASNAAVLGNRILDIRKNRLGMTDPVSSVPAFSKTRITKSPLPAGVTIKDYKGFPSDFEITGITTNGTKIRSAADGELFLPGVTPQQIHDLFHTMNANGYTMKGHALFRASERLLGAGNSVNESVSTLMNTANNSAIYVGNKDISLVSPGAVSVYDSELKAVVRKPISIHQDGNGEIITITPRNIGGSTASSWFRIL